jgi:phage terminase large subunit GpA-like protein
VSQWADRSRKLSPEASAEPGQWDTARAEYQREMMDAANDPDVDQVVIMTSAQVGKTEVILNTIGYHIDYDPCPILIVQPDITMAETFSKDRVAPMLRDTPAIRDRVADPKSRDSNNRILHKSFPGGRLTIVGAIAPSGLAGRPVRVVLFDEVDRMPHSAGTEGDPIGLAVKRTTTFWNRKIIMVSTPTVKGLSRIEAAFEETDKRRFLIPCPHCRHEHALAWGNVKWDSGLPGTARMVCPSCSGEFSNAAKNAAVRRGRWQATAPFKGKAGFHLNELYSPWKSVAEVVADFLEAKVNPTRLQVFINTSLGETWEEAAEQVTEHELMERVETYAAPVPARGLFLTIGADTQPDRIEAECVAWGAGEESWSIEHAVFHGDPDIAEGQRGSPWDAFTNFVRKQYRHETGQPISASYTMIDSGGHNTQAVYDYVKRHKGDRVFAVKGRGGEGVPIVGPPNRKQTGKMKRKVDLYIVGVDNAKSVVMKRLRIDAPGPGYCHFPAGRDVDWFRQLTAEKVVTKFVKGFPRREWKKDDGRRNEALDCRVYAFAACVMAAPQFDKIAFKIRKRAELAPPQPQDEPQEAAASPDKTPLDPPSAPEDSPRQPRRAKRRGGFVKNW